MPIPIIPTEKYQQLQYSSSLRGTQKWRTGALLTSPTKCCSWRRQTYTASSQSYWQKHRSPFPADKDLKSHIPACSLERHIRHDRALPTGDWGGSLHHCQKQGYSICYWKGQYCIPLMIRTAVGLKLLICDQGLISANAVKIHQKILNPALSLWSNLPAINHPNKWQIVRDLNNSHRIIQQLEQKRPAAISSCYVKVFCLFYSWGNCNEVSQISKEIRQHSTEDIWEHMHKEQTFTRQEQLNFLYSGVGIGLSEELSSLLYTSFD